MLRFRQLLNIVLYDLKYRSIRFGISFCTILNIVLYDFEYRTIRFGISYYTILNIVLYDSGYRTIRFGISYYTIRNIVLYDSGYRSIRFGISFYTIWNIVLYDSVNRCPVQPKPGWWVGRGLLRFANHPLTLPPAMQMDVCGGNKCHTCRWGFRLAVMWLSIIHNHLIHSKIRCF